MQPQPELLDRNAACEFFGGSRPIHVASLYRGIRQNRYPRPVKVGPGSAVGFAPSAKLPFRRWSRGGPCDDLPRRSETG